MLGRLVPGAALAALLFSSPGNAQSVDDDVRCLLLGTLFQSTAKEPAVKQAANAATQYYLGRVSARVPSGELKARFLAQATRLKPLSAGPMMNACFKQMQAQGRAVDAVRQELSRSLPKQAAPTKK
jgi:hypothetical protein